jgi:hypothetical protein
MKMGCLPPPRALRNPRPGLPMIVAIQDKIYSVSEVRGQIREMIHFPSNGSG